MVSKIACRLCGNEFTDRLYEIQDASVFAEAGIPGVIYQCNQCGFMFKEFTCDLETFYSGAYTDTIISNSRHSVGAGTYELFADLLKMSINYKAIPANEIRLLDVGSGAGILLEQARTLGLPAEGIEFSPRLADVARSKGLTVHSGNVENIQLTSSYDVIMMIDIIEHLTHPGKVLSLLKLRLKPGGIVIIYTPNHDSFIVKIAQRLWRLGIRYPVEHIFASPHVSFFSQLTLNYLLTQTGFMIHTYQSAKYNSRHIGEAISRINQLGISCLESLGKYLGYAEFRLLVIAGHQ